MADPRPGRAGSLRGPCRPTMMAGWQPPPRSIPAGCSSASSPSPPSATRWRTRRPAAGGSCCVAGEAGVGKTALVRALLRRRAAPARVLWGACDALFTPRPLGPFLDVAAEAGGALAAAITAGGSRPRRRGGAAARRAGAQRPTIVVLEDVHWADEATLDVAAAARPAASATRRVLVVATYRDDELDRAPPAADRARRARDAAAPSTHLDVGRCRRTAVAALAEPARRRRRRAPPADARQPVLRHRGARRRRRRRSRDRPRRGARARRAAEPDGPRSCSTRSRSSPQRVEVWLLEALAGEAPARSTECLASGMLVGRDRARSRFRHELARLAIDETLEPRRRLALHRQRSRARGAADRRARPRPPRPPRGGGRRRRGGAALRARRRAPAPRPCARTARRPRSTAARCASPTRSTCRRAGGPPRAATPTRATSPTAATRRSTPRAAARSTCHRAAGDRLPRGRDARAGLAALDVPGQRPRRRARTGARRVELLGGVPAGAGARDGLRQPGRDLHERRGRGRHARTGRDARIELGERCGDTRRRRPRRSTRSATMELLAPRPGGREHVERSLALALDAGLDVHVAAGVLNLAWAAVAPPRLRARRALPAGRAWRARREPDLDLWRLQIFAHAPASELEQGRLAEAVDVGDAGQRRPAQLAAAAHPRQRRARPRAGPPRRSRARRPLLDEAVALGRPERRAQRIGPRRGARAPRRPGWPATGRRSTRATDAALALALERDVALARRRSSPAGGAGRARRARPRRCRSRARLELAGRPARRGGALGAPSAARTRRRSRWPRPTTTTRCAAPTTRCASSTRRRPPRSSRGSCASAASAASPRGPRPSDAHATRHS